MFFFSSQLLLCWDLRYSFFDTYEFEGFFFFQIVMFFWIFFKILLSSDQCDLKIFFVFVFLSWKTKPNQTNKQIDLQHNSCTYGPGIIVGEGPDDCKSQKNRKFAMRLIVSLEMSGHISMMFHQYVCLNKTWTRKNRLETWKWESSKLYIVLWTKNYMQVRNVENRKNEPPPTLDIQYQMYCFVTVKSLNSTSPNSKRSCKPANLRSGLRRLTPNIVL